jgi:hypothetical protein
MAFKMDSEGPRHVHECSDCKSEHTPLTLQQNGAFADILENHKHVASGVEINHAGRIVRAVNGMNAIRKLLDERLGTIPPGEYSRESVAKLVEEIQAIAKVEGRNV